MANIQDAVSGAQATVNATTLALSAEEKQPSDLCVTATAAPGIVTVTLPAAGAGLFHYITSIDVHHVATAAAVVGTAVVAITSTNLPGNPAWATGNAAPIGVKVQDLLLVPSKPIKSLVVNTATTIVCATMLAGTTQRAVVNYFVAK